MKTVLCKAQRDFIGGKMSKPELEKIILEQKSNKTYIAFNQSTQCAQHKSNELRKNMDKTFTA